MLASLHSGIAHLVTKVGALVFSNNTVLTVWRVQRLALLLQGTSNLIAELAAHIHHMQCVKQSYGHSKALHTFGLHIAHMHLHADASIPNTPV